MLLLVAYKVLELVFPANLQTFFNLSQYILYEQYGARGGAGRLTTISYIYNTVFKRNMWNTLIGSGLGGVATEYAYTIGKLFVSFGVIGLLLLSIWSVSYTHLSTRKYIPLLQLESYQWYLQES